MFTNPFIVMLITDNGKHTFYEFRLKEEAVEYALKMIHFGFRVEIYQRIGFE